MLQPDIWYDLQCFTANTSAREQERSTPCRTRMDPFCRMPTHPHPYHPSLSPFLNSNASIRWPHDATSWTPRPCHPWLFSSLKPRTRRDFAASGSGEANRLFRILRFRHRRSRYRRTKPPVAGRRVLHRNVSTWYTLLKTPGSIPKLW